MSKKNAHFGRKIIHVDMDAFYASVEILDNPDLAGKPLAVGGNPRGRGVVSAASYEARKYGVRSAMASYTAKKLCPKLIFVKPRFERYKEISNTVRGVFFEFSDQVQMLSLDEAWLDVTENKTGLASATETGRKIKNRIAEKTGLTCSVGISFNKVLAKLCSEEKKPNGFFVLTPNNFHDYLMRIPVDRIPGIGKATMKKMEQLGIVSGKDLFARNEDELEQIFGKNGRYYYRVIRGIHLNPVSPSKPDKSISVETTFDKDLPWGNELHKAMEELLASLWERRSKRNQFGRTLNLKIKFHDFVQITRSHTEFTHYRDFEKFKADALQKLENTLGGQEKTRPVRLLGIGLSNLIGEDHPSPGNIQLRIFD